MSFASDRPLHLESISICARSTRSPVSLPDTSVDKDETKAFIEIK